MSVSMMGSDDLCVIAMLTCIRTLHKHRLDGNSYRRKGPVSLVSPLLALLHALTLVMSVLNRLIKKKACEMSLQANCRVFDTSLTGQVSHREFITAMRRLPASALRNRAASLLQLDLKCDANAAQPLRVPACAAAGSAQRATIMLRYRDLVALVLGPSEAEPLALRRSCALLETERDGAVAARDNVRVSRGRSSRGAARGLQGTGAAALLDLTCAHGDSPDRGAAAGDGGGAFGDVWHDESFTRSIITKRSCTAVVSMSLLARAGLDLRALQQ